MIIEAEFVGECSSGGLKPLTIFFEYDLVQVDNTTTHQPKLTVEVPILFPFKNNKMVSWNYNYNYVNEATTTNILGNRGMT